jgi:hypothetical protein
VSHALREVRKVDRGMMRARYPFRVYLLAGVMIVTACAGFGLLLLAVIMLCEWVWQAVHPVAAVLVAAGIMAVVVAGGLWVHDVVRKQVEQRADPEQG